MSCKHNLKDTVEIINEEDYYDPWQNGNTHQCIGPGAHEHCWKYGKIIDGKFVEDEAYVQKEKVR